MCNKLWYGIESISNSHCASSQLSGEFMLLHSIHTLANLALKETVPTQPQTSPQVIVTIYIQYSEFRASVSCSKILNAKSVLNTVKIFRANSVFQGERRVAQKSWMAIQYSENFEGKIYFWRQTQGCSKILNNENIFNRVYSVYIHLGWFV